MFDRSKELAFFDALRNHIRCRIGEQGFDDHLALQDQVFRKIDCSHTAGANRLHDPIFIVDDTAHSELDGRYFSNHGLQIRGNGLSSKTEAALATERFAWNTSSMAIGTFILCRLRKDRWLCE